MNKTESIRRIKDIVADHGGMLAPHVTTSIGDVYIMTYVESCDDVNVEIITGKGELPWNHTTETVGIEYFQEKDIENILKSITE